MMRRDTFLTHEKIRAHRDSPAYIRLNIAFAEIWRSLVSPDRTIVEPGFWTWHQIHYQTCLLAANDENNVTA